MTKILLLLCCLLACGASRAEDDGEEFLNFMRSSTRNDTAQPFVDDAVRRNNGHKFCVPEEDRKQASFNAVKEYLETHPGELFKPRRYLIVRSLEEAFPCPEKK
jgi:hypothetical protein